MGLFIIWIFLTIAITVIEFIRLGDWRCFFILILIIPGNFLLLLNYDAKPHNYVTDVGGRTYYFDDYCWTSVETDDGRQVAIQIPAYSYNEIGFINYQKHCTDTLVIVQPIGAKIDIKELLVKDKVQPSPYLLQGGRCD